MRSRASSGTFQFVDTSVIRKLGGSGEKMTKKAFYEALARFGLQAYSPLFEPIRGTLDFMPDPLSEADAQQVKNAHLFLSHALDGELVFPNFDVFSDSLNAVFDTVQSQLDTGHVASYIPQLACVNPDQFGASACSIDGQQWSRGDAATYFSLQSVSKAITYAIILEEHGTDHVHKHIGREPSGVGFNERVLNADGLPHNPLINSGAIMACALLRQHQHISLRFDTIMDVWTRLCGGERPQFNNATFLSERDTADRNFCLAYMMREENVFPPGTVLQTTLELYFMTCSIEITCNALASAAATLASGGICPLTGERVFSEKTSRNVLSVMASCGMYNASGQFCFDNGFPAKSGVGGGLMMVIPGKVGFACFSPRLDVQGNSVRGVRFAEQLAKTCDFHQYSIRGAMRQQSLTTVQERAQHEMQSTIRSFVTAPREMSRETSREMSRETSREMSREMSREGSFADSTTLFDPTLDRPAPLSRGKSVVLARGRDDERSPPVKAKLPPSALSDRRVSAADDSLRRSGSSSVLAHESELRAIRQRTVAAGTVLVSRSNNELLFATWVHNFDHVRVCVARGANVDYADYDSRTALHVAACEGFDDIILYLLAHGADRAIKDRYGRTPLEDARRLKHDKCVAVLEAEPSDLCYMPPMPLTEELEKPDELVARIFMAYDIDGGGQIPPREIIRVLRHVGFEKEHSVAADSLIGTLESMTGMVDMEAFGKLIEQHPMLRGALENTNALANFQSFAADVSRIFWSVTSNEGELSDTVDTYLRVDPKLWGVAVCSTTGQQLLLGDYKRPFCVDACGKIIVYLCALDLLGAPVVHQYVGKEPNGRNFNDLALNKDNRPHNPVINAGTMMVAALIHPEKSMGDRFAYFRTVWQRLVGGTQVGFDNETYLARLDKGLRSRTLAYLMADSGAFPAHVKYGDLNNVVDFFYMITSFTVTAQQLAIATATLANGGVNPITNERIFRRTHVMNSLSIMASCGLYDHSGEFTFHVGMPAKCGVSGGLIAVSPGTLGVCTYSPRIDAQGLSPRGAEFLSLLSEKYNFHVYDSLVRSKSDPTIHNDSAADEQTCELLNAASKNDVVTASKILSLGLNPDACDYDRRTALHVAAAEGHVRMMRLLLEKGASPMALDRWGCSAIDEAKRRGAMEHVRMLSTAAARKQKVQAPASPRA
jgi:glutaminase